MGWTKKGKYYATNGYYTMSWNDVKEFTLYYRKDFVKHGTKKQCLDAFKNHQPVQEQTNEEWLEGYNKPNED